MEGLEVWSCWSEGPRCARVGEIWVVARMTQSEGGKCVCVCVCESAVATAMSAGCRLVLSPRWRRGPVPRLRALLWARGGSPSRCRTMGSVRIHPGVPPVPLLRRNFAQTLCRQSCARGRATQHISSHFSSHLSPPHPSSPFVCCVATFPLKIPHIIFVPRTFCQSDPCSLISPSNV